MEFAKRSKRDEAAYITIVEGPPPEFVEVDTDWTASLGEGPFPAIVAMCETRTLNGEALVERCRRAWQKGLPARLDFPGPDGGRAEVEIVAARWERAPEGQKLILWVKLEDIEDDIEDIEEEGDDLEF
ncbi:MAG: hypothetical protein Kow0063_29140 [Anaerolineae bacterium]